MTCAEIETLNIFYLRKTFLANDNSKNTKLSLTEAKKKIKIKILIKKLK